MSEYGRSAREQREHDRLRYPGTDILINKFDLRSGTLLESAERAAAKERLQDGLPETAREQTTASVKAIHHHLFQDIYDWAGEFRQYTTGRGPAPFATPDLIEPFLDQTFDKLRQENCLKDAAPDAFARRAAHYVNEINAAHPFVEGNGRTQRVWLRNMAEQAGYDIKFQSSDREQWYQASASGFHQSDDAMAQFIAQRLRPGPERTRGEVDRETPQTKPTNTLKER